MAFAPQTCCPVNHLYIVGTQSIINIGVVVYVETTMYAPIIVEVDGIGIGLHRIDDKLCIYSQICHGVYCICPDLILGKDRIEKCTGKGIVPVYCASVTLEYLPRQSKTCPVIYATCDLNIIIESDIVTKIGLSTLDIQCIVVGKCADAGHILNENAVVVHDFCWSCHWCCDNKTCCIAY